MIINSLTFKQKLSWLNHIWKAIVFQHHKEMVKPFSRYIQENSVIIDVGAHSGQYTKLFSKMAPKGHVFSFEPGSYAQSLLSKVTAFHGLKNITLMPYALGSNAGSFVLNVPIKKSGSLGFGQSYVGEDSNDKRPVVSETINITVLDTALKEAPHGNLKIDFIKADIEGHEFDMLKGAKNILEKSKPTLWLEVSDSHLTRAGASRKGLFDYLKGFGYHPIDLHTGNKIDWNVYEQKTGEDDILFQVLEP